MRYEVWDSENNGDSENDKISAGERTAREAGQEMFGDPGEDAESLDGADEKKGQNSQNEPWKHFRFEKNPENKSEQMQLIQKAEK